MILHLGVMDIPYEDDKVTTGDVAGYLEDRYKILQTFFDMYADTIADFMADSLAGQIENMMAGAPPNNDPFSEAMSKTHDLFVKFLDNQEMNGKPGVPTKRALDGISKRFKMKKGEPRPSFIDTGAYQASMRAWVSGVINAVD